MPFIFNRSTDTLCGLELILAVRPMDSIAAELSKPTAVVSQ